MKIDSYNLSKLSNEAENFKEDVQNILNYGKYSANVVSNTPPAWTARNGEFVFFASGTIKRLYFYNINAWDYIEYNAGTVAGNVTNIVSSDIFYTSLVSLSGLNFSMGVNETWTFDMYLAISNGGASYYNINAPGGSTLTALYSASSSLDVGTSVVLNTQRITALNTNTRNFFTNALRFHSLNVHGAVQTSSSSGSLSLRSADADSIGTTVFSGSYFVARKIV